MKTTMKPNEIQDLLKRIWHFFYLAHEKEIQEFVTDQLSPSLITGKAKPPTSDEDIQKFIMGLVEQSIRNTIAEMHTNVKLDETRK